MKKKKEAIESRQLLVDLMNSFSPSGNEKDSLTILEKYVHYFDYYSDKIGNRAWSIGSGPKKILLSGHIDEVNGRVSSISDSGIISFISTGGMCKKSLVASEIVILNEDNKPIVGVVEKKAIHCERDGEESKVGDICDMKVNVGAESREEVEKLGIHPGCCVVYQRRCIPDFGEHQICGTGLDDKVGVYITARIIEELSKDCGYSESWTEKYTVIGLAATQEETGCRGAQVAAKEINPDISIDFDVTFATDGEIGISKSLYGDVSLGKGGVIEWGPDKSIRIGNLLREICYEKGISCQNAPSRAGGTNTSVIQLRAKDCETMLISIPNRSMHTPVEVCDWRDIDSIITMVVDLIKSERL